MSLMPMTTSWEIRLKKDTITNEYDRGKENWCLKKSDISPDDITVR
jgi:hypothetical protein